MQLASMVEKKVIGCWCLVTGDWLIGLMGYRLNG
jgi:hypothetical protein